MMRCVRLQIVPKHWPDPPEKATSPRTSSRRPLRRQLVEAQLAASYHEAGELWQRHALAETQPCRAGVSLGSQAGAVLHATHHVHPHAGAGCLICLICLIIEI